MTSWGTSQGRGAIAGSPSKAFIIGSLVTVLLVPIAVRLSQLQLIEGALLRRAADNNRLRVMPLPPGRGPIVDRRGQVLATTRLARSLFAVPARRSAAEWRSRLQPLAAALDLPLPEVLQALETARQSGQGDRPLRLAQNLSQAAYTRLVEVEGLGGGEGVVAAQHGADLFMRVEPLRIYPQGQRAAHVLGTVRAATVTDLQAWPHLPPGATVGQSGVERLAEVQLQGRWGREWFEADAKGRPTANLAHRPAEDGQTVRLTIDLRVQQAAEAALAQSQRRGAVVVLEVNSGAVVALASRPDFDPNQFTGRIDPTLWQALNGPGKPLLDRTRTGYPPGSTFKIVTAVAGMRSGKFPPGVVLTSVPKMRFGGTDFGEHGGAGYGAIGYAKALEVSSNTFFYQVGWGVGPEAIARWGHALGIGRPSARLGLAGGQVGQILTPAEKPARYGSPWYVGDTISSAIGQGLVLATPVELATMVAAVANGGFRLTPHLLAAQTGQPQTRPEGIGLSEPELAVLRQGLTAAVTGGTAKLLNAPGLPPSAGKTGTAEVPHGPSNAMFVGYAPRDRPQIAVAVAIEGGGYGGVAAAPVAAAVFRAYFGGS